MGEGVAHEVHTAALPRGGQHLGNGGLDALMRVRDDQLDAPQAATGELAQEPRPEGLGLGWSDVHAEHLAAPVAVDPDRHDHRHRHDPALAPRLHVGGVDPQIRPIAFDGSLQECAVTRSSISAQSRLTWLLEMPLMPSALTKSSTERVEIPWM